MAKRPSIARLLCTLVYVDEPQVILLERDADAKVIAVAIDKAGYRYPFLGAEISASQWDRYRRGFLDLRYLFLYPRWRRWYLFDLAEATNGLVPLRFAEPVDYRNEAYLPEAGFFSRDHTEFADDAASSQLEIQTYAIDGSWDLPDFSQFYSKVTDLYSFFLSLSEYVSPTGRLDLKKAIGEAFRGHPLRGGSSYINLYNDLYDAQDIDDRLIVKRIQYASPGRVDVDGRADIFEMINLSLDLFAANYNSIKTEYLEIHKYLHNSHLLKRDAVRIELESGISKFILNKSKEFASIMHLDQLDLIYKLTDKNPLSTIKILLSFYRRMERYYLFFAEGRVKEHASPEKI